MYNNNTQAYGMNISRFMLMGQNRIVNDVYQRSFKMNTDKNTIRKIENTFQDGRVISNLNIIKDCNTLMGLSAHTTGMVAVSNGWNEKRLSFILEVEVTKSSTLKDIYFLNGYTDYFDPILGNQGISNVRMLDPNMLFHINTITVITEMITTDGVPKFNYKDKITILKKNGTGNNYDDILNNTYLIRPSDVLSDVYSSNINDGTDYGDKVQEADRVKSNTVGYISSIMNSIIEGTKTVGHEKVSHLDYIHNMANAAETPKSLNCPFLLKLYQLTGEANPSWFTVGTLLSISPHLDAVTSMLNLKEKEKDRRSILSSNMLSNSLQPTISNLKALEFYQLATSLCFENMISQASLNLSNHPNFTIGELAYCLDSNSIFHSIFNTPSAIESIDINLRRVILPKLTQNGELFVNIVADINILGTSTIAITINNEDPEIYRYNSSMDNTFSPYISDRQNKLIMAEEVSGLIDMVLN